jgi:hypothetical protein
MAHKGLNLLGNIIDFLAAFCTGYMIEYVDLSAYYHGLYCDQASSIVRNSRRRISAELREAAHRRSFQELSGEVRSTCE